MIIFIDADGCPVVDETVHLANTHHIPCVILCDTSHQIWRTGAQTIIVSKGADSVDFALVNRLHAGDIAVTQDYGLGARRTGAAAGRSGIHTGKYRCAVACAAHREKNPPIRRTIAWK